MFFSFFLVYCVILGIFWITLSCRHMWGSVQVIWMIFDCVIYWNLSTTLREHHVQKFSILEINKIKIKYIYVYIYIYVYDYFENFLTLECNLDPIAEHLCDSQIKSSWSNQIAVSFDERMQFKISFRCKKSQTVQHRFFLETFPHYNSHLHQSNFFLFISNKNMSWLELLFPFPITAWMRHCIVPSNGMWPQFERRTFLVCCALRSASWLGHCTAEAPG